MSAPLKLQIFEEDLQPGMDLINLHVIEEEKSQAVIQNTVLEIYRAGLFKGVRVNGGIIIEDKTNPKTFIQKLKYLFGRK